MIKIGLTGPTGAGKSTVATYFTKEGFAVVDADALAHEVTAVGSPTLSLLAERFGADLLREDGSLDRGLLAARAFADEASTKALNAITHPAVLQRMNERLDQFKEDGEQAVIIDAPLLFEAGIDAICDLTVAVLASPDVRLARIIARDGITEDAARARMSAQPDERFYLDRATLILHNDDPDGLTRQLTALAREIGRCYE